MKKLILLLAVCSLHAEWSAPVDVLHELKPCVTYRARLDGDLLVVHAAIQPEWHTFAIDNERRAAEKLAGKKSLGIDQPTQIKFESGLEFVGPWHQSQPKDFSKPDLRWYSFGFEKDAYFVAKVKRTSGPAQIGIRGQACSGTTCKNIDVSLTVPPAKGKQPPAVDMNSLVPVR
jgi:hypothetical protein